jgi:hypothetical protein
MYIPTFPKFEYYRPDSVSYIIEEEERRMEARSEEVQRWLKLSAAFPLAITLMLANDPVSHPPLLDAIIDSSRRWRQFEASFLLPLNQMH